MRSEAAECPTAARWPCKAPAARAVPPLLPRCRRLSPDAGAAGKLCYSVLVQERQDLGALREGSGSTYGNQSSRPAAHAGTRSRGALQAGAAGHKDAGKERKRSSSVQGLGTGKGEHAPRAQAMKESGFGPRSHAPSGAGSAAQLLAARRSLLSCGCACPHLHPQGGVCARAPAPASDLQRGGDGLRQRQHLERRAVGHRLHGAGARVGDPEVAAVGAWAVCGRGWLRAQADHAGREGAGAGVGDPEVAAVGAGQATGSG